MNRDAVVVIFDLIVKFEEETKELCLLIDMNKTNCGWFETKRLL
jgi:hypothetical protein